MSIKYSSALFPAVRLFSKFFALKIIYMLQLPAARPCTALNCISHWAPVEYSTPFHWNRVAYSTQWNVHSTGVEQSGMVESVLPGEWNGAISQLSGATLESGMEEWKLCKASSYVRIPKISAKYSLITTFINLLQTTCLLHLLIKT